MFIRDLYFSCLRRWYFLVAGLILTLMASYYVFGMVSPSYDARASVVLIPPAVAVTIGDNPYLYLGGLDLALGVLQVRVSSPEVATPLLAKFSGSAITVSKDVTTSGPIMAVSVSADTPEETMELLQSTTSLIPQTLDALQQDLNVPAPSVITSKSLSQDVKPTIDSKRRIQMTAIAAGGGVAGTLLITGYLDRLLSRSPKDKWKHKEQKPHEPKPNEPKPLPKQEAKRVATPVVAVPPRAKRKSRAKTGVDQDVTSVDVGT